MAGSAKDRLIRATFWHAAGRVLAALFGLATMGYAFHALGPVRYGLLTIVAVLLLVLALVEFGLRTATVHFTAADAAAGDLAAVRGVLGSATLLHLLAGAAVAIPFALLAGPLVDWFEVDPALRGEAVLLLRILAAAHVLGNAASSWTSVLVALQRTGPVAAGMVAGAASQFAGTVAAVEAGTGAAALGWGFAAGTLVRSSVEAAAAGRALPGVSILPVHATRAAFGRILDLGRHLQVIRVADVVVFQLDQVLVARFLGVGAGGVYRLANELVVKLRDAPLLLATGVLPAATEVRDAEGGRALRNLYLRGTKYVAAAAALGAALVAGGAPEVLFAVGGNAGAAREAAPVLAILAAGYLVNVCFGVACQVGVALGQARLQAVAAGISTAAAVVLVPAALAAGLGLAGAAAGTAVALILGPLWYLRPLSRAVGVSPGESLRTSFLPPLLPAAAAGVAARLLHDGPLQGWLLRSRGETVAVLAAEGAVLGALFVATLLLAGWADGFDRDILRRSLRPASREGER